MLKLRAMFLILVLWPAYENSKSANCLGTEKEVVV